jgi:DNA-binding PucR family transcriptional regulator
VPDPDGPGRHDELRRALRDAPGALGPTVALDAAGESARRARLALEAVPGPTDGDPLLLADDHLLDLLLAADARVTHALARHRLAPLDDLPAGQRERLVETLRAWLDAQGEARPAADRLRVHVQTVRYRVGQLRDVLGPALDDPEARLELALALRVRGGG